MYRAISGVPCGQGSGKCLPDHRTLGEFCGWRSALLARPVARDATLALGLRDTAGMADPRSEDGVRGSGRKRSRVGIRRWQESGAAGALLGDRADAGAMRIDLCSRCHAHAAVMFPVPAAAGGQAHVLNCSVGKQRREERQDKSRQQKDGKEFPQRVDWNIAARFRQAAWSRYPLVQLRCFRAESQF